MKRFAIILLIGTAVCSFIGGRIFFSQGGDRAQGDMEAGAFFALIGFLIFAMIAAAKLDVIDLRAYRFLWVVCCILYPLSIYAGYSTGANSTQSAAESNPETKALLLRNFEMENGRAPTELEMDNYSKAMIALSGASGSPSGSSEATGVYRQFFWGPAVISIYFYGLLVRKRRKGQIISLSSTNQDQ